MGEGFVKHDSCSVLEESVVFLSSSCWGFLVTSLHFRVLFLTIEDPNGLTAGTLPSPICTVTVSKSITGGALVVFCTPSFLL